MQVFTRRASESDCEILRLLEVEARSDLDQFRGGSRLDDEIISNGVSWSERLGVVSTVIFVAGLNDVVMGYLLAQFGRARPGKIATIEQVFVTKDARNLGIGNALVSSTIAWAKSENLVALDGYALPGDRETKNLYERSGMVTRLLTVSTDLKNQ